MTPAMIPRKIRMSRENTADRVQGEQSHGRGQGSRSANEFMGYAQRSSVKGATPEVQGSKATYVQGLEITREFQS